MISTVSINYNHYLDVEGALTDPAAGNDLQCVSDKVATVTITTQLSSPNATVERGSADRWHMCLICIQISRILLQGTVKTAKIADGVNHYYLTIFSFDKKKLLK